MPEPAARAQARSASFEQGCAEGSFAVAEPALASFGILERCVSIAHWFRPDGPLTAEQVVHQYAEFAVRIALPGRDQAG